MQYNKSNKHDNNAEVEDEPDFSTYKSKPIQNFGVNMLIEQGYTEERGIGKNEVNAKFQIIVPKRRPKGMGIGAEQEQKIKNEQIKVGQNVYIIHQPHDGLFGMVVNVYQSQLQVQLQVSGAKIKIKKQYAKLVTQQLLNLIKLNNTQNANKAVKEKKQRTLKWVYPNIRVKVINKQSKYYLKKVIVTEVMSGKEFECYDEETKTYFRELRQKDIQTVVPKKGTIIILKGDHIGKKGRIIERHKNIIVQTEEELQILKLTEDDIAQFVEI